MAQDTQDSLSIARMGSTRLEDLDSTEQEMDPRYAMDSNYNRKDACNEVEEFATAVKDGVGTDDRRLAVLTKDPQWRRTFKIICTEEPRTWRMLKNVGAESQKDDTEEEMVFTVHGIIHSLDLPPITENPQITLGRYRFLKQGLSLTGLGSRTFDEAVEAARDVYDQFDRQFTPGKLDSWSTSSYSGMLALDMSNRYFTPIKDTPTMEHIPFSQDIDPSGFLEGMTKSDYVHGEENQVHYFSPERGENGNRIFVPSKPQLFRVGDIVEVQISFTAVPFNKGQNFKMITVLHSIALLNASFTQEAAKQKLMDRLWPKKTVLKRKVGYTNEGASASKRAAPMEVDSDGVVQDPAETRGSGTQ